MHDSPGIITPSFLVLQENCTLLGITTNAFANDAQLEHTPEEVLMVILHGGHWSCTVKLREAKAISQAAWTKWRDIEHDDRKIKEGLRICIYIYTVYDYITLYALKCIYYVIHVIICVSMGRRDHLWDSEANSQTLLVGKPGGFSMSNDTKLRSLRKMFFVWVAVCIVKQRQGCLMTSIWKNVSNSQMLRVNACAVSVFFGWLVLSWCCGKAQQAEDGSGCFSTVIHLLEISLHQWYGSFARTRTRNARSEYLWILERLRSQDASTSVWKPYESHETDWFRLTPGKAPNQYLHNFAYISILWIYRLGCVDLF